jgi:hypothetical protein
MTSCSALPMLNWKIDSEYEFTKTLDDKGWAWEFLRRNAEYRASWSEFAAKAEPLQQLYGIYENWDAKALDNVADVWVFCPPRLGGESLAAWRNRAIHLDLDPVRRLLPAAYGAAWRLRLIRNPYSTPASEVGFLPAEKPPAWFRVGDVDLGGTELHELRGSGMYPWIDLEAELEPQFAHLQASAKSLQQELVKHGVIPKISAFKRRGAEYWFDYIRILDAHHAGAKPGEIASVLYPDRDNKYDGGYQASSYVTDRLEAAKRMTTRGYLALLP